MKVYYAHCVAIYDTLQEMRDIDTLVTLFPAGEVFNPNCDQCSRAYATQGMAYFEQLMKSGEFDVFAFRALPDGTIPAGVASELKWFREAFPDRPVIELPSAVNRRTLTLDQTREYLEEIGYR